LHQAVEAKEGVTIRRENATMATITFQNYFRMYQKLAGMTGTAYTEREEFGRIYNLEVVIIPTNRPMVRNDMPDQIYRSEELKFQAVARDVKEMHEQGRPVLIGTTSVETSERLSEIFKRAKIPHSVLNAKQHEREASIVTQAGSSGAVTIATNMAGRGTDILLGGNPDGLVEDILDERGTRLDEATPEDQQAALEEATRRTNADQQRVLALGGLHIIGTERHEARRIDNQLRGRAGRQGDPGSSQFYLSLEDELMRRFGRMESVKKIMDNLGGHDLDLPIQHRLLDRAIESAQSRVEGFNFDIRKHTVEFDDVMNTQRQVIYADRHAILEGQSMRERVLEMIGEEVAMLVDTHLPADAPDMWDSVALLRDMGRINPLLLERLTPNRLLQHSREDILDMLLDILDAQEMSDQIRDMRTKELTGLVERHLPGADPQAWHTETLLRDIQAINPHFTLELTAAMLHNQSREQIEHLMLDSIEQTYQERETAIGEEVMRYIERRMMLHAIDRQWIDYLTAMDELRQTITLQAYAQRNPLVEFKRQSFGMFDQLKEHITRDIVYQIIPTSFRYEEDLQRQQREAEQRLAAAQRAGATAEQSKASRTVRKTVKEPGRNELCPCGSGKKYKHCHLGRFEEIAHLVQQDGAAGASHTDTVATPAAAAVAAGGNGAPDQKASDTAAQKPPRGRGVPRGRAAPPAPTSEKATGGSKKRKKQKR
jgi:preprotein translocase subunit SecA